MNIILIQNCVNCMLVVYCLLSLDHLRSKLVGYFNTTNPNTKFLDAGIQDISTSISINLMIQMNLNDLTERCEDDQSDKHLEARDRRYSCLISNYQKTRFILWQNQNVSFLLKLTHNANLEHCAAGERTKQLDILNLSLQLKFE